MSKLFVNTIAPNSGDTVTISGSLLTTGKLTIGDASTDTVAFAAEISSSLIPDIDDAYNLGASGKKWKDLYLDGVAYIDSASVGHLYTYGHLTGLTGSFGRIDSDLTPRQNLLLDLGSPSKRWD